jgi:ribosomal protein L23
MDLSRVILGPAVTEKAERMKVATPRVYTLRIASGATKIDVKHALRALYGVDVASVRIVRAGRKVRLVGAKLSIQKRDPLKKAFVELTADSKPLDLTIVSA